MAGSGSSAKGKAGQAKQKQKYQNTFAFKSDKYSSKQAEINELPVQGLCKHCLDIIQWRKRMGQYKPLTVPKKCVSCSQKTVREAYHILCNACAGKDNVCAKCQKPEEIMPNTAGKTPAEILLDKQNEERLLSLMTERQRRSYMRKLERGDDEGASKISERITGKGDDDDDDFEFSDEDFEDDE
ncbi:hypothetical protein BC830DRAFT_1250153 [Chytriomyces sp. MP71]|nr:hypothetical protein BC830DRAFT_1250153 [Chytriomyces sp. MP71]